WIAGFPFLPKPCPFGCTSGSIRGVPYRTRFRCVAAARPALSSRDISLNRSSSVLLCAGGREWNGNGSAPPQQVVDQLGTAICGPEAGRDVASGCLAGATPCFRVGEQPSQDTSQFQPVTHDIPTSRFHQLRRLSCIVVSRAEEDRDAECGGLEHRVKTGSAESTPHISNVGEGVEFPQHTDPIDQQ